VVEWLVEPSLFDGGRGVSHPGYGDFPLAHLCPSDVLFMSRSRLSITWNQAPIALLTAPITFWYPPSTIGHAAD